MADGTYSSAIEDPSCSSVVQLGKTRQQGECHRAEYNLLCEKIGRFSYLQSKQSELKKQKIGHDFHYFLDILE
jgi:hypothetical protein